MCWCVCSVVTLNAPLCVFFWMDELVAMEERTAAIAARKQQREQRKKEAEEKRLVSGRKR